MNKGVKYPVKRLYRFTEDQDAGVARVAKQLTEQLSHTISDNEVIRRMIAHSLTCDLFLSSLSIDRKLFIDLHFD